MPGAAARSAARRAPRGAAARASRPGGSAASDGRRLASPCWSRCRLRGPLRGGLARPLRRLRRGRRRRRGGALPVQLDGGRRRGGAERALRDGGPRALRTEFFDQCFAARPPRQASNAVSSPAPRRKFRLCAWEALWRVLPRSVSFRFRVSWFLAVSASRPALVTRVYRCVLLKNPIERATGPMSSMLHWHGRVLWSGTSSSCPPPPDGRVESRRDQAEAVRGSRPYADRGCAPCCVATEATWCSTHHPKDQQSSSCTSMARVLLLAASAAALRPTLPRRSRTTRAALTMHDYDYDARSSVLHQIHCFTPSTRRWRASLIDLRA